MLNRSIRKHVGLTLLATSILVAPAWAQIESATVAVDGLACPFCAYGVEKRLKKVGGVESVRVSFRDNEATLSAKNNESVSSRSCGRGRAIHRHPGRRRNYRSHRLRFR